VDRGNTIAQNAATSAEMTRNAVAPSATRSICAGDDAEPPPILLAF
jgi:hypothetical protein